MKVKEEEADTKREVNGGGKTEQSHGGADGPEEAGRLVMTIHGRQKQLPFGPDDLLSAATMLTGDKVSSLWPRLNARTDRRFYGPTSPFPGALQRGDPSGDQRRTGRFSGNPFRHL